MTKITVRLLKLKGACPEQVALFASLYPDGVEPTKEACLAVAGQFQWGWAAGALLSPSALAAYAAAHKSALTAYDAATEPARAAYAAARKPALTAYDAATEPAWAAYDAARKSALTAYDAACSEAFAEAWAFDHP